MFGWMHLIESIFMEFLESYVYNDRIYTTGEEIVHSFPNGEQHALLIDLLFRLSPDDEVMVKYHYIEDDLKRRVVVSPDGKVTTIKHVVVDIHAFHQIFTYATPAE
jgi:hypothetical protein